MNVPRMSGAAQESNVFDILKDSSFVVDALAEKAARTAARRKDLVAQLATAESAADHEFPKLTSAIDAAVAEVKKAEKALQDLRTKAAAAMQARSTASFAHSATRDKLEAELHATCHPEIAPFISEMLNQLDAMRNARVPIGSPNIIVSAVTGKRQAVKVDEPTFHAMAIARINGVREAIAAAESMRLEADQSRVSERLQGLRLNLPAVPS